MPFKHGLSVFGWQLSNPGPAEFLAGSPDQGPSDVTQAIFDRFVCQFRTLAT